VDKEHCAAGPPVWLKYESLHGAGRCRDPLPSRVAQVEACALRQVMMIARTMLGLFRPAEYAKGEISSLTRW
jgi:hypothetical protein